MAADQGWGDAARRARKNWRMKRRILALVCIAEGMTQKEAGKHVGMAENSVGKWVNKYREGGINAVRDGELGRPRRKRSRSAKRKLVRRSPYRHPWLERLGWSGSGVSDHRACHPT